MPTPNPIRSAEMQDARENAARCYGRAQAYHDALDRCAGQAAIPQAIQLRELALMWYDVAAVAFRSCDMDREAAECSAHRAVVDRMNLRR